MTNTQMVDVLIIGAGPVGLTLASDLVRRGILCRIIEREPAYHLGARARYLAPRSLEVYEDLGLIEQLFASGQRGNQCWRIYGPGGKLVREVNPASNPTNLPTPDSPYQSFLKISQQQLESVLREYLASHDTHVELNSTLTSFTQYAGHVVASVQRADRVEEIQARYLVGCDGASSTVRKCAGIPFLGETWEGKYNFVGDVSVRGLDPGYGYVWTDQTGRFVMMLDPIVHNGTWFFSTLPIPDENGVLPPASLETLQTSFNERVGMAGVCFYNPTWMSIWRPNIRMVDRYRDRRVFLAGDAAHIHTPAGGQGMQTGIQDAYNLGWKLAHVLDGAPDALLDTYEAERFPVAQSVLVTTTRSFQSLSQFSGASAGVQVISNALLSNDSFADVTQLSITYRDGPLACNLDESVGIRAGDRAPDVHCIQSVSGKKVRLFDFFRGTHFTLLVFGEQARFPLPTDPCSNLRIYSIVPTGNSTSANTHTLVDIDGHAYRAYGVTSDALILIRPDGYIGLTGATTSFQPIADYLTQHFQFLIYSK